MGLVLASSSPRRQELLSQVLLTAADKSFTIVCPEIDESALAQELPADYVVRLALEKAKAGAKLLQDGQSAVVIGSDTIVVANQQLLGKPNSVVEAQQTLRQLSGQTHQVYTAVAAVKGEQQDYRLVCTEVEFCTLTAEQIDAYIATGEPMDKAGAYGIQGLGGSFVRQIKGSYSAVVGLPLVETRELLTPFIG